MMHDKGRTKLIEECGELVQACAKMASYPDAPYPDGTDIETQLMNEIGDVMAACEFVIAKLGFNPAYISRRIVMKTKLYQEWDNE